MKKEHVKGWWLFAAAILICGVLLSRRSSDNFSATFYAGDFRNRYVQQEQCDSIDPTAYTQDGENAVPVSVLRKGAISLKKGSYRLSYEYHTTSQDTVLRIFASDYTSSDNSGGKLLLQQALDPSETILRGAFALDQDVDSVYVMVLNPDASFQMRGLSLESEAPIWTDTYFYCAVTVLCALLLFALLNGKPGDDKMLCFGDKKISARRTRWLVVFVMAAGVLMASLPLAGESLLIGHDSHFHMARIEGLAEGLASGQFPVRVHGGTLNGYGYANPLFYPELLLYVPAVLNLLGVSIVSCYKFYLVLLNVLTVVLAYLPFQKLFKDRTVALTMAVVYLLNPYRLICLYLRSAVGEAAAITFLPLVLYGLYAILLGEQKDWLWLVFGATGILQAHVLSTELTALLAVVVVLVFVRQLFTKEKRILSLLYAAICTVLLNLWFLLPMVLTILNIHPQVFDRVQSPVSFTKWDVIHLFMTGTLEEVGPHPLGWIALFGTGFYVLYRILVEPKPEEKYPLRFMDTLLWTTVVGCIATTAYFPWESVAKIPLLGKILDVIQFPYRLMSLVGVSTTILCGYAVISLMKKPESRKVLCVGVVCASLFVTGLFYEMAFIRPNCEGYANKSYYATNLDNSLCVGQYEYLPAEADLNGIVEKSPRLQSGNETMQIENWTRYGTTMQFDYQMELTGNAEQDRIQLPLTYIPKYEICVNGVKQEPLKIGASLVGFTPTEAAGHVTVRYREPKLFRVSELVSLATLLWLVFGKKIGKKIAAR